MKDVELSGFLLAGGTNLALRLGHRKSVDLDIFSLQDFDAEILKEHLKEHYEFVPMLVRYNNTVKGFINNIKVDIITNKSPLLKEPYVDSNGIRLYSIEDAAAMKLSVISDNGTRLKDFVDVAYLSTKMSLREMITAYTGKYERNPICVLRGLVYFEDINFDAEIELTNSRRFDWKKIESRIRQMIKYENKIFENEPI
jgi:hypothetical protein